MSALLVTVIVALGALASAVALTIVASMFSLASSFPLQFRHLLPAVVIALANNVDNLGARLAYSVQGTRVSVLINAWISVITLFISWAAAYFGGVIMVLLGKLFASFLAMAMLVALGLWMILHARLQSWHDRIHEEKTATRHVHILKKPHHADIDDSKRRCHVVE